ncbi:MAG: arginine--tRNA ligase, partial [Planctomycetes bacterium]|nr:arginine--tRNA ligase [Planctomycetota bacterium]
STDAARSSSSAAAATCSASFRGLVLSRLAASVEVAGPGFINVRIRDEWLSRELTRRLSDDRLGAEPAGGGEKVVVDYSAPNLAKEMHVGHLRSTIIGDCLARVLELLGHRVIRQNHVGDWGTQFGMLTAYLDRRLGEAGPHGGSPAEAGQADRPDDTGRRLAIPDMEEFYRQAKRLFDTDADFAASARRYVVRLQGGDERVLELWRSVREQSLAHCRQIYSRLGVELGEEDVRGESAYNDDLPEVVEELRSAGLLAESQGALCVFLDEFKGKDGRPLPLLVRKSGGGYLYATTDLAAIRYRVRHLGARRILYVVDARQSLHFRQVFAVARRAGFAPADVSLEHVAFGTMMGPDGRPFRTRDGGTVKLADLLDEAEQRAYALVGDKSPQLPEDDRRRIARAVGIGAVKYADLSQNRMSDYVFSWDKMLSLEGNTAPYMQYAYARVRSIFRKAGSDASELAGGDIRLSAPAERKLALNIARFPETVDAVARECLPNLLCAYLYDLAGAFMGFYESCPVLQAPDAPTREGRLALCELTARTMRTGLGLLGIEVVEQM